MNKMKNIKCVIVGDFNSQKFKLLSKYITNAFSDEFYPVCSVNDIRILYDSQYINLCLWDTTGQEDYKKLRPLSYPHTDVFVLVFSLILPNTLENIENMWIPEIKEHCPGVPYILVGTESKGRKR